jgi:hypothetical protein
MTRLGLSVETRFLRIPTRWRVGIQQRLVKSPDPAHPPDAMVAEDQWCAIPEVSQDIDLHPDRLDGWELRNRFFRLKFDKRNEASVLEFLNDVGVWNAVLDNKVSSASAGKKIMVGAFGSRYFNGRALSLVLADLQAEQDCWRGLLTKHDALKAHFGPPPASSATPAKQATFALETQFFNELHLHFEWRRGEPRGVIETITGREMLIATIHLDLLRGGKFQVCKRSDCAIPFSAESKHKRKYCSWDCGHIESVRRARKRERKRRK